MAGKDESIGYLYLLKSEDALPTEQAVYKIGFTKQLKARKQLFGVILPFSFEMVCAVKVNDAASMEKSLHGKFADKHLRGEWFLLTDADVALCRELMNAEGQLFTRAKAGSKSNKLSTPSDGKLDKDEKRKRREIKSLQRQIERCKLEKAEAEATLNGENDGRYKYDHTRRAAYTVARNNLHREDYRLREMEERLKGLQS